MSLYKDTIAPFAVGRRVNSEEWNAITRTATGTIGFGAPVQPDTGDHSCKALIATTGQNVLGITEASQTLPHEGDAFAQHDSVTVCESGVIGVKIGANAVTKGAAARWDTANGVWTAAAQSATVVTIPGAEFETSAAAGAVGAIRYRRPVPSLSVSGV